MQTKLPDQPSERIASVVQTALDRLAGRSIQHFTPVLVERAPVEELRAAENG